MKKLLSSAHRRQLFLAAVAGTTAFSLVFCAATNWKTAVPTPVAKAPPLVAAPLKPIVWVMPEEPPNPLFHLVADQKNKPTFEVKEPFDKVKAGELPTGWSQWSSTKTPAFAVAAGKALSEPNLLTGTGVTNTTARAWLDKPTVDDAQVSAAVFLNTLIPAEVFVRGSGLDGATPSMYSAAVSRGMELQLVKVVKGQPTPLGTLKSAGYFSEKWVRLTIRAEGQDIRAQVIRLDTAQFLDENGQWVATPAWAIRATDKDVATGQFGVGRWPKAAGAVTLDDFLASPPAADDAPPPMPLVKPPNPAEPKPATVSTTAPPTTIPSPLPTPKIPRHYEHIRIAMLAYAGNPMGAFEDKLLKESVDLVVPNVAYLQHIHDVAPNTPQMIYTNTSNLYLELFTDWLAFADAKGLSREEAFFHAAVARSFRGDSPSSLPVTWFWGVYKGAANPANITGAARGKNSKVPFGGAGESLYLGHPDRFREINVTLASAARGSWSAVLEYPTTVDKDGTPTAWATLTPITDSTKKMTQPGQVTFDPPANWKPATIASSARLYFVRFRTGGNGTPPEASTILGRDYVGANGTNGGTIPVFDAKADANNDGYLDDAEFAKRAQDKDARFVHESRMLTDSYGQMRFHTNPSSTGFRDWCVDYHVRLAAKHPLIGGLFMDNAGGKVPAKAGDVLEPLTNYSNDCGVMLNAISKAIAPRWVLPNTVGAGAAAEPIIRQNPAYFEEFTLRPMSHTWTTFEDVAGMIGRRTLLTAPSPIAVLDSHPQKGTLTDGRMQIGVLAYYYLLADPESSFLMFFGGFEPGSPWERHWSPAAAYNVGKPKAAWSLWANGNDPANAALTYRVYRRDYDNAIVLLKPSSHARASKEQPTLADDTATKHELGGSYQPLQADGKLGEAVTTISLRNGEGAILIKVK